MAKLAKLTPHQRKTREAFALGQRRCYCGRQLNWRHGHRNSATIEHLIPKCAGGTRHKENVIIVCSDCNCKRGHQNWVSWIKKNNPPKAEWLIRKYLSAIQFYQQNKIKVQVKNTTTVNIGSVTINIGK